MVKQGADQKICELVQFHYPSRQTHFRRPTDADLLRARFKPRRQFNVSTLRDRGTRDGIWGGNEGGRSKESLRAGVIQEFLSHHTRISSALRHTVCPRFPLESSEGELEGGAAGGGACRGAQEVVRGARRPILGGGGRRRRHRLLQSQAWLIGNRVTIWHLVQI